MPRYYFDVHDDASAVSDTEGEVCASPDAAGRRAAQILSEIALHNPGQNGCSELLALVRDEKERVVFTATLSIVGKRVDAPVLLPGCRIITTGGSGLEPENLPAGAQLLQKPYWFDALLREVRRLTLEAHAEVGAPMTPLGLPSSHSGSAEGGAGEIAAPVSEPDKS